MFGKHAISYLVGVVVNEDYEIVQKNGDFS